MVLLLLTYARNANTMNNYDHRLGKIKKEIKVIYMDEFYSDQVMEHFMSPRNMHAIEAADAEGYFGDPSCGDYLIVFIKVENEIIADIGLLVFGCPASIATSSVTGELAKGKSLDEALTITDQDVIDALGGLPEHKQHCSLLAVSALRNAIEEYKKKFASSEVLGRTDKLFDPPAQPDKVLQALGLA